MKKNIFIQLVFLLILLFSFDVTSQNQLDRKNGFKDFTLGDSYSKWQNNLQFVSKTNLKKHLIGANSYNDYVLESIGDFGNVKSYFYNGTCCKNLFRYNIDKIVLQFSSNKLHRIIILTKKFQKGHIDSGVYCQWRQTDFYSINAEFVKLFGTQSFYGEGGGSDMLATWTGTNVVLKSIYNYMGVSYGDRQIVVVEKYEGGF